MRVFYDLTCPFCYLAQPFNRALLRSGASLTELPYQAHPEIPTAGMPIGPRIGPMYENIATRARALNLPLKWRENTLPNSRLALAAAEWTRVNRGAEQADEVREKLFHAHFAAQRDIGDLGVIVDIITEGQQDSERHVVEKALKDGTALKLVDDAERLGRKLGVMSTPTWESAGHLVSGLHESDVRRLVEMENTSEEKS